jgi:hypothetical protein
VVLIAADAGLVQNAIELAQHPIQAHLNLIAESCKASRIPIPASRNPSYMISRTQNPHCGINHVFPFYLQIVDGRPQHQGSPHALL